MLELQRVHTGRRFCRVTAPPRASAMMWPAAKLAFVMGSMEQQQQ